MTTGILQIKQSKEGQARNAFSAGTFSNSWCFFSSCSRPLQKVEPGLRWFKPGQSCTNVKPGQLGQGNNWMTTYVSSLMLDQPGKEAVGICTVTLPFL